ncbi:DUF1129 family protein [Ornithinibacillus scapharcae]|uniref:DUF1129 family protein n=1 Tax=Ornithinibacillus scapharcae TaxID=1147159 RepID=UPI000225BE5A|nr:DUF1129 family protein [Ornithinibacillus scapharcae]
MNSKDIIKLNNEMRKELTEENEAIYGDMLVYIRLNAKKSEQQTEEVLLELLEHLLQAQKEGKSAKDVFGSDLKQYCEEVIKEIPGEKKSQTLLFGTYLIFQMIGLVATVFGVVNYGIYHLFEIGYEQFTFTLGKGIVVTILGLVLLFIFVAIVLKWMKSSTFKQKKPNKWVEFLQIWLICTAYIALTIFMPFLIPDFGVAIHIPNIFIMLIGILFILLAIILNKRYRITK